MDVEILESSAPSAGRRLKLGNIDSEIKMLLTIMMEASMEIERGGSRLVIGLKLDGADADKFLEIAQALRQVSAIKPDNRAH